MSWSVIIPCCILNEDLKAKFQKAYQSVGPFVQEIIVIENGSDELKGLADRYQFPNMIGYAAAVNEGLKHATGDFILILNSDAELQEVDWVSRLSLRFAWDEKIGIVIPMLKNDGEPQYTKQIVGPCWALRRETLDCIGPLRLEYGMGYFEDSDYYMEAKKEGWKVVAEEGVRVNHSGQSTFKVAFSKETLDELFKKNYDYFNSKWHGKCPVLD